MPAVMSKWQVRRENGGPHGTGPQDEFGRGYEFLGMPPLGSTTMFGIVCTLESGGLTTGNDSKPNRLSINRRLRFYLRPLRLTRETAFVVELRTADWSLGRKFDTLAVPAGNSEMALFDKIGRSKEDVAALFNAILSGQDMTFTLFCGSDRMMQLHLQNDLKLKQLCEETYKRFIDLEMKHHKARFEDAYLN